MNRDDAKRLTGLEQKNARLTRLLTEKEPDNSALKVAIEGMH